MISDQQWAAIQELDGQELRTVGRGNSGNGSIFTVRRDTPNQIRVVPAKGRRRDGMLTSGEPRPVRRIRFDQALGLGVPIEDLRPGMLNKLEEKRMASGSYVVAILRELRRRGLI